MKIAITNPTTWPYVRRGAERFVNELAFFLTGRGHHVTIIATKPGAKQITHERGYRTLCHRRLWHPNFAKAGLLEFHAFMPVALMSLLKERYDVVHCCTFMDAYAARLARMLTGVPYVFLINGLPPRTRYVRSLTTKGAVFKRAVCKADEVISVSRYMWDYFEGRFGRGGMVLPIPVDTERFELSTQRDHDHPIILCASALDDERKGGRVLMQAFDRLKGVRPQAILQISCMLPDNMKHDLLQLVSPAHRKDVHFLGAGDLDDLPKLFGRAAISVLPSHWEAFGMVMIESMATGTPVVGTRDGAIPELISDPGVGRMFDTDPNVTAPTNVHGLFEAMLEGLELSRQPETPARCRAHAEQFSWARVGPRYEEIYERLLAQRKGSRS